MLDLQLGRVGRVGLHGEKRRGAVIGRAGDAAADAIAVAASARYCGRDSVCSPLCVIEFSAERFPLLSGKKLRISWIESGLPFVTQRVGIAPDVAREINEPRRPDGRPKDPNYRAEVSYWKMEEDDVYGRKDSIRIDVLENAGRRLVCVYDIKTGQSRSSGLSLGRMLEIAKNVLGAYPDVERIIITEVRPRL
jgi:hypothetical protein